MKSPSYPLTLAAAKKNESSLWDIGDALVKECPSDGNRDLKEVAEYLQTNGCEYTDNTLWRLRKAAASFPAKFRRRNLAFEVHSEAETPAMLDAVIKGAPKGTVISSRYVRKIVDQIRDQEERERREAYERAQAKREAAEAKEREKLAKAQQAKNKQERESYEAEHREAQKQTEAARKAERESKTAPKKDATAPKEEEVPLLLVQASFLADAREAARLARRSIKAMANSVEELTPKGVAALTVVALEAANAWTEAAQMVRKEMVEQRGHIAVLEK